MNQFEFTYAPAHLTLRDEIALKVMSDVFKDHGDDTDELRTGDYAEFVRLQVDAAYDWADEILIRRQEKRYE